MVPVSSLGFNCKEKTNQKMTSSINITTNMNFKFTILFLPIVVELPVEAGHISRDAGVVLQPNAQ